MRKITTTTKKPAAPAATAKPSPAVAGKTAEAIAKPSGSIVRGEALVKAARYPFGHLSDADSAYLAFFATFAKASKSGAFTVAELHASGAKPAGISITNNNARAIRLRKAGFLTGAGTASDPFRFASAALTRAEYTSAKPRS